jgi:hypothetical protein
MCRKLLCVAVLTAMFSLVLGGTEAQAKKCHKSCKTKTCQTTCCPTPHCHGCNPCTACYQQPACGCQSFATSSYPQPVYVVKPRHHVTTSVCYNW